MIHPNHILRSDWVMSSSYRVVLLGVVIVLLLAVAVAGCGRSGRPTSLGEGVVKGAPTADGGSDSREASIVTPPDGFNVNELPERYQELFNQPIWNAVIPATSNWDAPEPPAPDPAAARGRLVGKGFGYRWLFSGP